MPLYLGDNDFVKFEHEGKHYVLHIHDDPYPDDPRNWGGLATMACFHRRYNLGDKIGTSDPDEFWQGLVADFVLDTELVSAVQDGKVSGMKLEPSDDPDCVTLCVLAYWATPIGSSEADWTYDPIDKDPRWLADAIRENLTIGNCQKLLEPYCEWMPLWLYDHSGITISCGARTGQYADRWDSGCVGWIVAMKDKIMAETTEILYGEDGKPIRVEYKHEGRPSTYGVMSRPLTDATWRKRAIEIMEGEVEVYDQYLRGEVYGYTLYEQEDDEWTEEDSCFGFYGDDVLTNGIADNVPGLAEAVASSQYEEGKAQRHTVVTYSH